MAGADSFVADLRRTANALSHRIDRYMVMALEMPHIDAAARGVAADNRGVADMMIETASAEVGLVAQANGNYQLALYRRAENRMIRIDVDAALAWAICGAMRAPVTAIELPAGGS